MTAKQKEQILQWYNEIPYNCLKSAIRFYEQGDEVGASKLLVSEQDKLRVKPELVELLKESFPSYKKQIDKN